MPFFFTSQLSKKSCSQKWDIPLMCMNCQLILYVLIAHITQMLMWLYASWSFSAIAPIGKKGGETMNDSEQYKEHIEYTFAAFCKVVLRNASLSAYRDIGRRQKREISLDYLMEERYYNPSTTDSYFTEQTSSTELIVCGERIVIENERLAKVLSDLPKLRQEVLVLYFFFGYTDKKIGEMYGKSRTTVNYWKIAALKQLRKEMERLEHEEQEIDTF